MPGAMGEFCMGPPLPIRPSFTDRHWAAFAAARHTCRLESWGQIVIALIVAIVGIVALWTLSGSNEAVSEIILRSGATIAIILIFPVVYLWNLLDIGPLARRKARMIIVIGLVGLIASASLILVGVVLEWQRPIPGNAEMAKLRDDLAAIQGQLASMASPPATATPAQPQHQPIYNEKQIRDLLDSLNEAKDLAEKFVLPTSIEIETAVANSFNRLPEEGATKRVAEQLRDLKNKLKTSVWDKIDKFVYEQHSAYKDQMRLAFDLDNEVAKGELNRKLLEFAEDIDGLPDKPTSGTLNLIKGRFEETRWQSNLLYNWAVQIGNRVASMTNNLRNHGKTGLEK